MQRCALSPLVPLPGRIFIQELLPLLIEKIVDLLLFLMSVAAVDSKDKTRLGCVLRHAVMMDAGDPLEKVLALLLPRLLSQIG